MMRARKTRHSLKMMEAVVRRIGQLDALRGLAALAVVLFHFLYQFPTLFPDIGLEPVRLVYYGGFGVDLFFMISGFVIFLTLERRPSPKSFFLARVIRLFPAYWVAATGTFFLMSLYGLPGLEVRPVDYLANLTMLQEILGFAHVDGAYWSLQVEWIFYLSVAMLLSLGTLKRPFPILVLWLACAILTQQVPWQAGKGTLIGSLTANLLAFRNIHLFIMGAGFFLIYKAGRVELRTAALVVVALAVQFSTEGWGVGLLTLGFAAVMACVSLGKLQFLAQSRVLAFLGSISYSLYLVHQHNGYMVMRALLGRGAPFWLAVIVALALALILATLLNRLVEEPAARILRHRFLGKKATVREQNDTEARVAAPLPASP